MKRYQYYQPNKKDLKDRCPDCSIRALTKFEGITWVEAFDKLVGYARESQTVLNALPNIKRYMEETGYPYPACYKDRLTVLDFAKARPSGTYCLYVRSGYGTHLVTVEDGAYFDTWDCGKRLIYGYWTKGGRH